MRISRIQKENKKWEERERAYIYTFMTGGGIGIGVIGFPVAGFEPVVDQRTQSKDLAVKS